jgi:hypothetical protein
MDFQGKARYSCAGPGRIGVNDMVKKTLIVGLIWAAGCATSSAERIDESAAAKLAEFDRTGETVNCLSVTRISSIEAVDEKTLLIRTGVTGYYVSDLKNRCNGATSGFNRFEYSTSTGQLCRNELLRIVDNGSGMSAGSCGMGSFEKLVKKPPAEPVEQ